MSHDSKRILIHNYYTPKLPADSGIPSLTSNRIAGDYTIQTAPQPAHSSAYPEVPDDVQAKLLHVGMRIRKHVADGHRVEGSIPSYQPNYMFNSFAEPAGSAPQQLQQQRATRNMSAPASLAPGPFGERLNPRPHLKRGRVDEDEDADADADTDDDEGMEEPVSFQDQAAAPARRLGSMPTAAKAKVFYVPTNVARMPSIPSEDFEDATFLASRESLN